MTVFSNATWDADMHPAMWMARAETRALHVAMTGRDLVITSGRRKRTPGGSSLHPDGRAMDIRQWYLRDTRYGGSREKLYEFVRKLREILGEDFDVVIEGPDAEDEKYRDRQPHIHIEYQPKGRHAEVFAD